MSMGTSATSRIYTVAAWPAGTLAMLAALYAAQRLMRLGLVLALAWEAAR